MWLEGCFFFLLLLSPGLRLFRQTLTPSRDRQHLVWGKLSPLPNSAWRSVLPRRTPDLLSAAARAYAMDERHVWGIWAGGVNGAASDGGVATLDFYVVDLPKRLGRYRRGKPGYWHLTGAAQKETGWPAFHASNHAKIGFKDSSSIP